MSLVPRRSPAVRLLGKDKREPLPNISFVCSFSVSVAAVLFVPAVPKDVYCLCVGNKAFDFLRNIWEALTLRLASVELFFNNAESLLLVVPCCIPLPIVGIVLFAMPIGL